MKVWEMEHKEKSIAAFGGSTAGSMQPTKRQSSLLKNLVSKFNVKQREHRRLRIERLINLFKEWDFEYHGNNASGDISLPEFQDMLENGMELDLDNRRVLEIYNTWEDSCESIEQEISQKLEESGAAEDTGAIHLGQTTRAREFAKVMLRNMLYPKEEEGGPKPEKMAPATRREHSPSVANLMGDSAKGQADFLKLGALFEAQESANTATDTDSEEDGPKPLESLSFDIDFSQSSAPSTPAATSTDDS